MKPPFVDLRDDGTFFEPPDDCHTVVIDDPDAKALMDLFLPPDGTRIDGDDLAAALERLAAAVNVLKQLRGETDRVKCHEVTPRMERES